MIHSVTEKEYDIPGATHYKNRYGEHIYFKEIHTVEDIISLVGYHTDGIILHEPMKWEKNLAKDLTEIAFDYVATIYDGYVE
jgi:hypothetical protein